MKIVLSTKTPQSGSVFMIAVCTTALFALVLGSYLALVEGQADTVSRAQNYNSAIPVAESGVEEAMALLNKNFPNINPNPTPLMGWTNGLTSDGWNSLSSSNTTSKSNFVGALNYYYVTISNSPASSPVITSAGVVPYVEHAFGLQMTTNRSIGNSTVALVRTIQVQTTSQAMYAAAIAAKGDIIFHGGATVDSFNSLNTNLSVNGQYSPTKVDDQATVGTDAAVVQAIDTTGNVSIRGYVDTGPGGTVVNSGSVSIGDNNWVSNGTSGVETSRSSDNFNVSIPDISTPTATFVEAPLTGIYGGTNYSMVFEGNNFWGSSNVLYQTSLSMTGQQKALVTNGSVTIYIPANGSCSIGAQCFIYVAPGSSCSIYCGAASATLRGGGMIGATNAANMAFYGLPTCTSISYAGSTAFIGTIYAPEADFTGTGGNTIIGALVANTFDFIGGATVHYDESLAVTGPSTGFVATNWSEVVTSVAYSELAP